MSFRQFGGLQYASKHNAVASYYNTSNNLLVTQNVGQSNSYINFESDISGNQIFGNLDISGNLTVSGDIDVSGNINVTQDIDCSGNITASKMYLTAPEHDYADNEVVPRVYVDSVAAGLTPVPSCYLCSNEGSITLSGYNQTIDGVHLTSSNNGNAILVNAQGGTGGDSIDNGIYIVRSGAWPRASYLASGDVATGTATYITTGVSYGGYTFVGTSGTKTNPAIIDASYVLWSQFGYQVQYGQGLYKSVVDGSPVVSVDSSLNFIQYLDNTAEPNPGTMYIGTNTNTVNIGKTSTTINGNVGIGTTPAYTLDVGGNLNATGLSTGLSSIILNLIYPVGSIYMNYDSSNNPSTVLSWPSSSWSQIPGGTTLVALYGDTFGDPSFNIITSTGGTPSVQPHNHQWYVEKSGSSGSIDTTDASTGWGTYGANGINISGFNDSEIKTNSYTSNTVNNADPHSNYPPYVVVSMWRRTT